MWSRRSWVRAPSLTLRKACKSAGLRELLPRLGSKLWGPKSGRRAGLAATLVDGLDAGRAGPELDIERAVASGHRCGRDAASRRAHHERVFTRIRARVCPRRPSAVCKDAHPAGIGARSPSRPVPVRAQKRRCPQEERQRKRQHQPAADSVGHTAAANPIRADELSWSCRFPRRLGASFSAYGAVAPHPTQERR